MRERREGKGEKVAKKRGGREVKVKERGKEGGK